MKDTKMPVEIEWRASVNVILWPGEIFWSSFKEILRPNPDIKIIPACLNRSFVYIPAEPMTISANYDVGTSELRDQQLSLSRPDSRKALSDSRRQ